MQPHGDSEEKVFKQTPLLQNTSVFSGFKRKHTHDQAAPPSDDQSGKKRKKNVEYQKEWELEPELKGWLSKSRRVDGKAFCKLCNKDLEYKNGGVYDLKRHAQSESHKVCLHASQAQPSIMKAATN